MNDIPCEFMKTAAPGHITGIMKRNRNIILLFYPQLSVPEQFIIKFNGMDHRQGRHFPSKIAVPDVIDGPECMTAFAHDNAFGFQPHGRFKMHFFKTGHHFPVPGIHAHIAVVPAGGGRHGPVDPGNIHNHGRLIDKLGTEFRLRPDHGIKNIRSLFLQRDSQIRDFFPRFILLPLQCINPLIIFHPHLIHGGAMAVGRILDILRNNAELMADPAHKQYQIGNVYAKGTVHRTPATQIAFGKSNFSSLFHKINGHPAFFPDDFRQCLFNFAGRRKFRVGIIGQIIMAGVAAQSAMDTGFNINLQPGPALFFNGFPDHLLDPVRGQLIRTFINAGISDLWCIRNQFFFHLQ